MAPWTQFVASLSAYLNPMAKRKPRADPHRVQTGRVKKRRNSNSPYKRSERESPLREDIVVSEREQAELEGEYVREPRADPSQPEYADWTEAEIELYNLLADRGAVPMLPDPWKYDFPTLPEQLFTNSDEDTLINTRTGREFQAAKALISLFKIGTRARDRLLTSKTSPANLNKKAVDNYIKWAFADGHIVPTHPSPPIVVTCVIKPSESPQSSVDRLTSDLRKIALRYISLAHDKTRKSKEYLEEDVVESIEKDEKNTNPRPQDSDGDKAVKLPALYGIHFYDAKMAFVIFNTDDYLESLASPDDEQDKPAGDVRIIARFDWADPQQDVWNGFAVALLACMVRDKMADLQANDDTDA